jgi:superfamily II DNA or RNA helicase
MVTLKIDRKLHLFPLPEITDTILREVKDRLTFPNPAYLEAKKRGFSTWNKPQEVRGYRVGHDQLIVPRGFTAQMIDLLRWAGVPFRVEDRRRLLAPVDFDFKGELWDFQVEAVEAMASCDFGTLAAPAGSGKTIIALGLIARRQQPALVVVHTKELLEQWIDRLGSFLGIPARKVGVIGGGKKKIGHKITVALVQSLYKCALELASHIGFLIVDEAHHCPNRTFTEAVSVFDSKFMLGLSATPWRRDGLSRLIYWHLGDKVHEVDKGALVDAGHILQVEVIWRKTNFEPTYDPSEQYSRMLSELTQDLARNALIADDVAREAQDGGGVCLVLSDRKAHCETLVELLAAKGVEASLLTGDLGAGERIRVVADLNTRKVQVLVATMQLLGEGFDSKELSTLFLASPIKFDGRLLQCLGRVLRPAPRKTKARLFDYIDMQVGVLRNAARSRGRVYGETPAFFGQGSLNVGGR